MENFASTFIKHKPLFYEECSVALAPGIPGMPDAHFLELHEVLRNYQHAGKYFVGRFVFQSHNLSVFIYSTENCTCPNV